MKDRFKKFQALTMWMTSVVLFVFSSNAFSQTEDYGLSIQSFTLSYTIWDSRTIPVCWVNPKVSNAAERNWVQQAVADTWERHSSLDFTGWGQCPNSTDGNTIRIAIEDIRPHVDALGEPITNYSEGMTLNFTFENWTTGGCSLSEVYRLDCIEDIAVHEFGHALGFSHEQNRDDTPDFCDDQPNGQDGDTPIGDWDIDSVMNYCNPLWNGDGMLSDGDIRAVQAYYGGETYIGSRELSISDASEQWWADMDGDGKDDLIYKPDGYRDYRVKINSGSELDEEEVWGTRQYSVTHERAQWFLDLNNDGYTDVVYNRDGTREYRAMLGSATGFGSESSWGNRSYAINNVHVQWWIDMNNDDLPDLVYKRNNSKQYRVKLSTGSSLGTEQLWGSRSYSVGDTKSQWFEDLNNDDLPDLVYKRDDSKQYRVKLNTGSSLASEQLWGSRNYNVTDPEAQWWADIDNDGDLDLVYRRIDTRDYRFMLNTGSSLGEDTFWGERSYLVSDPKAQWLVDWNNDGFVDLIYKRDARTDYHIMEGQSSLSLENDNPAGHREFHTSDVEGQWIMDLNGDSIYEAVYQAKNTHDYRLLHLTFD